MADPFIDPEETQSYGAHVRKQMEAVVKGLVPELDGAIAYCIERQAGADAAMRAALDAHADRASKPVTKARAAWIVVYNANKTITEGVLRHAGKLALLSQVFDDLAEFHEAHGVSDDDTPDRSG
jgi:hypothetical protein